MMTVLDKLSMFASTLPATKNVWTFLDDQGEICDSYTYMVSQKASTINCLSNNRV
jgi:hypothetical protein